MAEKDEVATITIGAEEKVDQAFDAAAKAAEDFAKRVNAAFASIKTPDIGGQLGEHGKKVKEHATGIASTIEGMTERIGSSMKAFGASFGEGGKILGEMSEGAVKGVGAIALALTSLGGFGKQTAKDMASIGEEAEQAAKRSAKAVEGMTAAGGIASMLKSALTSGPAAMLAAGAALTVGGGVTAAYFGGEEAEKLERLSHAAENTYEEFRKIAGAGLEIGASVDQTAQALTNVNEMVRSGALQVREMAESWAMMQDRIQYIKDAIKEQAIARQEAEHSAQDAAADAQHNIQQAYHGSEQAAQGVVDAQQRYEDVLEEYQRHGRPRTAAQQREYEEKHRKLALEAAERGVKEAERAKSEADRAVGEARHKAEDQERLAGEQRERMQVQGERMPVMLERMQNRLEAMRRGAEQNPLLQLLMGGDVKMEGLAAAADKLEHMMKLTPNERMIEFLNLASKLPEGPDTRRVVEQMFPGMGQFLEHPEQFQKMIEAAQSGSAAGRLPDPGVVKTLAESAENLTRRMQDISTAVANIGAKSVDKINEAVDAVKNLIEGAGAVRDIIKEWYKNLGDVDDKLGDINKKLGVRGGGAMWGEDVPSRAGGQAVEGRRVPSAAPQRSMWDVIKGLLSVTPAGAAELTPEEIAKEKAFRGEGAEKAADQMDVKADQMDVKADKVTVNADKVEGGGGGGGFDPSGKPRGLPPGAKFRGGQGQWTDQQVPSQEGGTADVSVYRPPSASEIRRKAIESGQYGTTLASDPVPGSVPATPGTGVTGPPEPVWDPKELEERIKRRRAALARFMDPSVPLLDQDSINAMMDPSVWAFQRGGHVSGPGTGTSDSILARLSNGEYVVNARAVARVGRGFLDAINGFSLGGVADAFSLGMPRFQGGGTVSAGPAAALHPVTINLPGGHSFTGFHGTPDAISQISRHAVLAQASSTMASKPSWFR
jgi:hypothetical protein